MNESSYFESRIKGRKKENGPGSKIYSAGQELPDFVQSPGAGLRPGCPAQKFCENEKSEILKPGIFADYVELNLPGTLSSLLRERIQAVPYQEILNKKRKKK